MEYLLRNRYAVGQVVRYRGRTTVQQEVVSDASISSEQSSHEWQVILQQRVIALEPDGSAHTLTWVVPEYEYPEQIEAVLEGQRQVNYALVNPCNHTVLSSSPTPVSTFYLPEKPIEVGVKWAAETPFALPPAGQVAMLAFHYTFTAIEEVQGRSCAVLELSAPETSFEVTLPQTQEVVTVSLSMQGTVYFDHQEGLMVGCQMETQTTPRAGEQSAATITQASQELVSVTMP